MLIKKLIKTISNVGPKVKNIVEKLGEIIAKLSKLAKKLGKGAEHTSPSAAARKAEHTDVHAPKEHTSLSSAHSPDSSMSPSSAKPHDGPGTTSPSKADSTSPSSSPDGPGTPSGSKGDGTSSSSSSKGGASSRPSNPKDTDTPVDLRRCANDPIDVATGEMVLAQVDAELLGVLPLVLRRVHVSSYRAGLSFGRSWASTVDQRLEFDDQGAVFVAEDGMLLVYPVPPLAGEVMPDTGPRWPLRRTPNGFAIIQRETGRTLHFAPLTAGNSRIASIEDRNANRIDFDRDVAGVPVSVRHSGGYHLEINTDDARITDLRLLSSGGEDVTVLRFGYNDAGDLSTVFNSSNRALRFDYDEAGRITQWTDRNGEWYRYFYDGDGRCIANQGSGGFLNGTFAYDRENWTTRFTDALGHTTTYQFDERNHVVSETDPLGYVTRSESDVHGRLRSRTDALGHTTRYDRDAAGNVVSATHPDGTRTLAEYNEYGLPVTVVDADGAVWRRTYDERGNLVAVADPAGAITRYDVGARGHITRIIGELGQVRTVMTNPAGLPLQVTDAMGARTSFTRDQFGRIGSVTDPAGGIHRYAWTVEGELLSRTTPEGATERWRYDGEGNQVQYIDASGGIHRTERTHFDLPAVQIRPDGSRSRFSYDANLRVIAIDDAQGLSWRFHYDAAGRLVGETDSNGRELRYRHNGVGQVVERTNAAGQVTAFVHDDLGNVTKTISESGTAEFAYDPMGRVLRAANPDAEVIFERDLLGRVLRETVNGRTVGSTYDLAGRRIQRVTPTGAASVWDYDGNGKQVALSTAGRTMTFGFDVAGREVERLVDTGTILAQSWDRDHRLISQTVSTVAGNDGHATRAQQVQHRHYRYRPDGLISSIEDQLTGVRTFDLDPLGRITAVAGSGWSERYTYDELGNITTAGWPSRDGEPQGVREHTGTAVRGAGAVRYQRDRQGRVTQRQKKRLSAKPATWRYQWNADDRLVSVSTPDGVQWKYRYDAFGRRVAKDRLGTDGTAVESVHFTWDGMQLAEQVRSDGRATTWNFELGTFRPVTQTERLKSDEVSQEWVDEQFYSIVTDLIGSPTELVSVDGSIAWHQQATVWGQAGAELTSVAYTPLRFPGQYHDAETGLNYNHQRYYDPELGQYLSPDPLGAGPGPNPYAYAPNPLVGADPVGFSACVLDQIDKFRARYQVGKGKNIAIAHYDINGTSGELPGVSGMHQYPGTAPMPAQPRFDPTFKQADSEWKMLEQLSQGLDSSASGKIHIYSERPVCGACQDVVDQFRRAFPNIEVSYSDFGRQ
jgi:RHS repeat-associated protein